MDKQEYIKLTIKYYKGETKDSIVYGKLAKIEKNNELKKSFEALSNVEKEHAKFFSSLLKLDGIDSKNIKINNFSIYILILFRYIFGLSLMLKLLERGETEAIKKYMYYLKNENFDEEKSKILKKIIEDEILHENFFEESEEKIAQRTERIRDAVYGMSDGLVEVLASVSGLAPVLIKSIYVAVGGFVVGISGSLSMAIGAYLSVKAQKDYSDSKLMVENLKKEVKGEEIQSDNESFSNPLKSAFDTGIFYIIGAIFPILPFLFLSGYFAIILSFILVILAQSTTSIIISILSGTPIIKSLVRTVSLTLIAAVSTFIIGNVIHSVLGINI